MKKEDKLKDGKQLQRVRDNQNMNEGSDKKDFKDTFFLLRVVMWSWIRFFKIQSTFNPNPNKQIGSKSQIYFKQIKYIFSIRLNPFFQLD